MNKGSFGSPLKAGGLRLSLTEAAYLVGAGRLEVHGSPNGPVLDLRDLMGIGVRARERFLEHLLVFRDLRGRGLMVKEEGMDELMVRPRGARSSSISPDSCFIVRRESDITDLLDLLRGTAHRAKAGLRTVVSVVDGDWDITHYEVLEALRPPRKKKRLLFGPENMLTSTKVPDGTSLALTRDRPVEGPGVFMGTDVDGVLLMSLDEASVLRGAGTPDIGFGTSFKHTTYMDLLSRGWLPKTGFKYGTHFRVYASGGMEGHSDLLVHCLGPEDRPTWEALSRAIRLSHSVRKRMVFSLPEKSREVEGVRPVYIELEWTRP
jgi:tRNA-intron endonuclease